MDEIMKTLTAGITFSLLLALLLAGCSPTGPGSSASSQDATPLICEVFYRPDAGQSLEAAPQITLDGNAPWEHEFADMFFEAWYQDDRFEGRALSIVVSVLETGAEITRQLYQFDPQNPLQNQFIGGHGFTGLIYIFHPDSNAEMQYFCGVKGA